MRKSLENLTIKELSYLAGLIDGNGNIFSQIVEGVDFKYGFTVRVFIVFFQKKEKKWFLMQMRDLLGFGVLRECKDDMVEYTINSFEAVEKLLFLLKPYIILKKNILIKCLEIIQYKKRINNIDDFLELCRLADLTAVYIHGKNKSVNFEYVKSKLKNKFPVETLQKV